MTESETRAETEKKGSCVWLKIGIFFSTIGIIILLLAYGYGYFQLLRLSASSDHSAALTELQNKINVMQQSMQKAESLSNQQEQLLSEWQKAQTGDLGKWHIVQAEYLVRMANDQFRAA